MGNEDKKTPGASKKLVTNYLKTVWRLGEFHKSEKQ